VRLPRDRRDPSSASRGPRTWFCAPCSQQCQPRRPFLQVSRACGTKLCALACDSPSRRGSPAALRWSAMTDNTPDIPLGSWLADLPDERLITLLQLRPDLAQPPPGSIAALAARAQARQSVKAATDELDFLRLAVLDALLVLQADTTPVSITKLLALIGDRAAEADVIDALDDLRQRALAWGESTVRVAAD